MKAFFSTIIALTMSTVAVNAEIVQLKAQLNGDKVDISWTGINVNEDYTYVIQKSKDGELFEDVSMHYSGSTAEFIEFFDIDQNPAKGTSFYRIKQVNILGEERFSEMVVVKRSKKPKAKQSTGVLESNVLVVVKDPSGDEYFGKVFIHDDKPTLEGKDLEEGFPDGMYRIVATSDETIRNLFIRID